MARRRTSHATEDAVDWRLHDADAEVSVSVSRRVSHRRSSSHASALYTVPKSPTPNPARGSVHIHVQAGEASGWSNAVAADSPPQRKRRWLPVRARFRAPRAQTGGVAAARGRAPHSPAGCLPTSPRARTDCSPSPLAGATIAAPRPAPDRTPPARPQGAPPARPWPRRSPGAVPAAARRRGRRDRLSNRALAARRRGARRSAGVVGAAWRGARGRRDRGGTAGMRAHRGRTACAPRATARLPAARSLGCCRACLVPGAAARMPLPSARTRACRRTGRR